MWRHGKFISNTTTTVTMLSIPSSQTLTLRSFRTLITLSSNPITTLFTPPPPQFHPILSNLTLTQHRFLNSSPITTTVREFFRSSSSFVKAKCISSFSTPSVSVADTVERDQTVPETAVDVDSGDDCAIDEDVKPSIPVKAYFVSTSVDLKSLEKMNKSNYVQPTSRMTNYVVLRFGSTKPENIGLGASISGSDISYMIVFQYGSIVMFNVRDDKVEEYLKLVTDHHASKKVERRHDEYEVREKPSLDTWMEGGLDYIMLQYLNIDGIRTIGSVLGQSIALDYYVHQVDGMVAEFTDINRGMEKTGTFTMQRKKLFQLVGKANSNLADVILKLGLFERSDIAWKDAKYAQIWEYLRDEFELTQRFASLDFKLKFVEHNIRFLQEILQNRKSDFLEWLIIVLIGAEIIISVYDIAHKSL
ncbi:protein RETARDED ROOT GROWTH-LIKE-like [Rutidosis leptorrhynchoides]|uniref:protein RETARDED ROOT GROWTH-LIKE-like n=1 Tax=Rutidosis leptorrhynchoides TaxID=125765 RepID=UPI003A98DA51